jgi:hypothetical protein
MSINSQQELERAVAEFQRLAEAPEGSSSEQRRRELDAEIKAFYAQCSEELRPGRPRSSE